MTPIILIVVLVLIAVLATFIFTHPDTHHTVRSTIIMIFGVLTIVAATGAVLVAMAQQ